MINTIINSSIKIFPVEIFHEIFDYLDATTIFCGFYNICYELNSYIISYDHYKLDLSSILKSDFDFVISFINPINIISLILSDDYRTPGQTDLFISLINFQDFARLRSLSLLDVEERNLIIFLQNFPIHNLISLTIKWRGGSFRYDDHKKFLTLLSSSISQSKNLKYLNLNLWFYEIKELFRSNRCGVEYLLIDNCSLSDYYLILHHSPYLKKLISHNGFTFDVINSILSSLKNTSYNQLFSLSLENIENIQMNMFESLLTLTPSLVHLKLTGNGQLSNMAFSGYRWKDLIEQYLRFLNRFQIFFTTPKNQNHNADDSVLLTISFSDDFWLEKKRWFIKCDYIKNLSQIRLYSIPICQSYLEYINKSNIIETSTHNSKYNDFETMNGVRVMSINLSAASVSQKDLPLKYPVFPQVNELILEMSCPWQCISLQMFSQLFNLSHIVKISLNIDFFKDPNGHAMTNIINLLEQMPNIHTFHNNNKNTNSERICSIVPRHIKHLQVHIDWINDMKMIVKQLNHLSSISFQFSIELPKRCDNFIKWLNQRETLFTYRQNLVSLHIWFDNSVIIF